MKDKLYTVRWALSQIKQMSQLGRVHELADHAIEKVSDLLDGDRELIAPNEAAATKLVVIVGHERSKPGADFDHPAFRSEYDFNKKVAELMVDYAATARPMIDIEIIYRDGIGISGAYRLAESAKPDACIELHFNSFSNKSVVGTETLCTSMEDDRDYASIIHRGMVKVFNREGKSDRGVKVLPRNARGAFNVYKLPGMANCLVEPFFGSNGEECKLAHEKIGDYARELVESSYEFFMKRGLIDYAVE